MKLVKEITSERDESVDGEALYFNPVIYDYAKKNGIPLYELLRCLQCSGACLEFDWVYSFGVKWKDEEMFREILRPFGFQVYLGRKLLLMDIFGVSAAEAEKYIDAGAGMADNVLFTSLGKLNKKEIKSSLDVEELGLRKWGFNFTLDYFYFHSIERGLWKIPPFIFGYAKSFERRNLLINYNEMPWRDVK